MEPSMTMSWLFQVLVTAGIAAAANVAAIAATFDNMEFIRPRQARREPVYGNQREVCAAARRLVMAIPAIAPLKTSEKANMFSADPDYCAKIANLRNPRRPAGCGRERRRQEPA